MKQVKKIAVALILFVAATGFVNAQSKLAHIDVTQLLSSMPEMKTAEAELKKLQETYSADLENSMKEFRNKATQYQNESPSKTEEENKKRSEELMGFQQNINEAEQTARQQLQQKQAELMGPITEKAKVAIEKVAAALGFDYVLDAQPQSGLIVAKGKDLLADVKKELGI